ncbi:hypothetical protein HELRODRAFT_165196 [Helobdella robusta]|uniref:Uncharacterized protein n=1 Tax=Helobdella robusta TaxID=6412 RepID=T1EWF1_HELRO|nr:hypothetical protein HELRODRAFT_165196 [Helobdella robusta]ESN93040.1 hypothetical protein HELRODRAFT_165196 [Helobdella robusta]
MSFVIPEDDDDADDDEDGRENDRSVDSIDNYDDGDGAHGRDLLDKSLPNYDDYLFNERKNNKPCTNKSDRIFGNKKNNPRKTLDTNNFDDNFLEKSVKNEADNVKSALVDRDVEFIDDLDHHDQHFNDSNPMN